jgi:hypothetical protein
MKIAAMALFLLVAGCASSTDPQAPSLGKAAGEAATSMTMQCAANLLLGLGC